MYVAVSFSIQFTLHSHITYREMLSHFAMVGYEETSYNFVY